MRTRMCGRLLLAAAGLALLPGLASAQPIGAVNYAPEDPQFPLPLFSQRPENGGFFVGSQFYMMHQTRTVSNDHIIAVRGYIDSTGFITGQPGRYVGDGQVGLSTEMLGRTTWEPGWEIFAGYKFGTNLTVTASYMHLEDANYTAGATLVPPFQRARPDLADTFLVSPVFNFPVDFAGPRVKTAFDNPALTPNNTSGGSNTYGVWNAASEETIKFTQRFQKVDLIVRYTFNETDNSRYYALMGAQFAWFWESFTWRTVSRDLFVIADPNNTNPQALLSGGAGPQDVGVYSNVVSNRMYGPVLGCGQEFNIGNSFSVSADATGSVLVDIVKERAKYYRGDGAAGSKRGRSEFQPVPNANLSVNLQWFPIEGVQVRLGYQALTFFNTIASRNPVDFNYGAIDPGYDHQAFRLIHGINVGVAFVF